MKAFLRFTALLLLAILGLEVVARLATTVRDDARAPEDWFIYSTEGGWLPKPGFEGRVFGSPRAFDGEGLLTVDADQIRGSDRPRILTIGGSNTFGFGIPTPQTYPELLDGMLPGLDVVNLSVPGYTSYQGRLVLVHRGLALRPVLATVAFNFNDRRYVEGEHARDGREHFQRTASGVPAASLNRSHLFRWIHPWIRSLEGDDEPVRAQVDLARLVARVPPDAYEANLRAMAEVARGEGVELVFLAFNDNPQDSAFVRRGVAELEAGRLEPALVELKRAVGARNVFSFLASKHLYAALTEVSPEQAAAVQAAAQNAASTFHGGHPIYLDSEYNAIMRSVAEEFGLHVVEVGEMMDADLLTYRDYGHARPYGHRRIAELLAERIPEILAQEPGTTSGQ